MRINVYACAADHGGVLDHIFGAKLLSALSLCFFFILQTLLTGVYVFGDETASWPLSTLLRSLFRLKSGFREPSVTHRGPSGHAKVWPVSE